MNSIRTSVLSCRNVAFARRTAAFAIFTLAGSLALQAQQANPVRSEGTPAPTSQVAEVTVPDFSLGNLASTAGVTYASSSSSSSSSDAAPADSSVDAARWNLTDLPGTQPPPRRSYGRPRYNDNSHNPDGSTKLAFEAGVGFTIPTADLSNYDSPSYSFSVGGGRRFSKKFATLVQFDWDNFGLQSSTVNNEFTIYNTVFGAGSLASLGGNAHIWSFTVDPTFNFLSGDKYGAYVVAGAGFYHKVTTFTTPTVEEGLVYGIYPEEFEVNATFDHYTSNAFGVNGGLGITYKPSKFANEQIFAEVRFVYMDNQPRSGVTIANLNNQATINYVNAGGTNFYPANSDTSIWLPIKFGIRF